MHADSTSNNFLKQFKSDIPHTYECTHTHTDRTHRHTHQHTQNTTEHNKAEMRHLNRMLLRNEPSQQCTAHM